MATTALHLNGVMSQPWSFSPKSEAAQQVSVPWHDRGTSNTAHKTGETMRPHVTRNVDIEQVYQSDVSQT